MNSVTENFLKELGELPDITNWTAEQIKDLGNLVAKKIEEKEYKLKKLKVLKALVSKNFISLPRECR